jgi:ribonuclease I
MAWEADVSRLPHSSRAEVLRPPILVSFSPNRHSTTGVALARWWFRFLGTCFSFSQKEYFR